MAASRTAARRLPPEQRQEQLTQAALAVVAEQGYAGLSLEDVAARAGVTRNLLYRYFPRGRLDVFVAAVERAGQELTADFLVDSQDPVEIKLARNVTRFVEHAAGPSDAWRVARHATASAGEPDVARTRNAYRDILVANIALNHFGMTDPGPVARLALRAYTDFGETALDEWRGSGVDRDVVLSILGEALLATVAAVKASG